MFCSIDNLLYFKWNIYNKDNNGLKWPSFLKSWTQIIVDPYQFRSFSLKMRVNSYNDTFYVHTMVSIWLPNFLILFPPKWQEMLLQTSTFKGYVFTLQWCPRKPHDYLNPLHSINDQYKTILHILAWNCLIIQGFKYIGT